MPRITRLSAVVLFAAGVVAASAAGGASAAPKITIKVTATEFKFKLSRTTVPRGAVVTFKVVNKGKTIHDFDFVSPRKGTKLLAPGKTASFAVRFAKNGAYRFVCTVPRHAQLGMAGKLRVT